jgi:predicted permease
VTVLSQHLWRSRYGARGDIIGASIAVDGINRVVVGVTPDIQSDVPGVRFDLSAPLPGGGPVATGMNARGVAWLKPGVSVAAARAELQGVSASVGADGHRWTGDLEAPSNIFWDASDFRDSEIALMVGAFLLLAIAGINVANLLLAGGQVRRAEFAVRRALGAGRSRLVRLLFVESLVLAVAGCAAGILLAWASIRGFTAIDAGPQLQTRLEAVHLDGFVLGYALVVSLLTALAFGILPALRGSAAPPAASLRESDVRTASRLRRLPGTVIAVEVGLSMVLLVVAGLVGRSFLRMRLADPGFAADRVLSVHIELPDNLYSTAQHRAAFFDALVSDAARLPGVIGSAIGYGATPPTDVISDGRFEVENRNDSPIQIVVSRSFVTPGYFKLMGIPLLAGSDFQAADLRNVGSFVQVPVVISRSFGRRFWPAGNPLGAGFRLVDPSHIRQFRVIGVAGDVWGSVGAGQIYAPLVSDRWFTEVLLRIADGAPPPIAGLRSAITRIDPQVPADEDLWTAAEKLHDFIHIPRFQAALFAVFAGMALILVAVGLAAVIAHAVSQRTREMGIRLALGARPSQVRGLVLTQGMTPAMIGLGLGLLASLALTRTMTAFLHGLSPTDPATLAVASVLLLGVALVAMLAPALRATRVDPVQALRSE